MLSKSSKYAIQAVLHIACAASNKKKIGSKEIANVLNIPAPFLAKTLQELSKNRIISSIKGPNGGFYLTKSNQEKSIFDIINCIDGEHKFEECFLGYSKCSDDNPCVVHDLYTTYEKSLLLTLKNKTIIEMARENKRNVNTFENLISHE